MSTVTQLISPAIEAKYQQLLSSLGSENNPAQWQNFMSTCQDLIPEVMLEKGRPSQKSIEQSMIGQLGFKSWKEMIEAPIENHGLNWSWDGWRSFRRAWKVVSDNPYLKEMDVKAGWVNATAAACKKNNIEFPATLDEYHQHQSDVEKRQKERKDRSVTDLKAQVKSLQTQIHEQSLELSKKTGTIEVLTKNNDELTAKVTELAQSLALAEKRSQKPQIKREPRLTRWQHFKAIFTGK